MSGHSSASFGRVTHQRLALGYGKEKEKRERGSTYPMLFHMADQKDISSMVAELSVRQ